MSPDTAGGRGVIYLSVGWSSLPTLLRRSGFGRTSWYLRTSLASSAGRRLLEAFNVRPIDLDSVDELSIPPRSTEDAMDHALASLDAQDVEPLVEYLAQRYPRARHPAGVLRSVLVRAIADRSLDAFYADMWASTQGFERVLFVGSSPWDRTLLSDLRGGRKVVGACSRALARLGFIAARLRPRLKASASATAERSPSLALDGSDPSRGFATAANATTLLVLNQGVSYGALYAYDHVFSSDPSSALHPSHVVLMGRTGGPGNEEGIRHGFPVVPDVRRRLTPMLRLVWGCLRVFGLRYPLRQVQLLAHACAIADAQAALVQRDFPAVRLAVFAFDLQVPLELVLALEAAGIRTAALNERPLSVVVGSQPFAVSTLLTASDHFTAAALASSSVSVVDAPAVGMWRTDFIRDYAAGPPPHGWAASEVLGQHRILVLPYHVQTASGFGGNPLATSPSSVRHFLSGILDLAEQQPDAYFLVRGKSDAWIDDPRFADLAERVSNAVNVGISRTYARLNESYRLVARADLVIAKYTSLVDEALACDIPCIVHDYTANSRDVARPVVRYLPRELWALETDELRTRVEWALADSGNAFRAYWAPHRAAVFGDLADGEVRARARQAMTDLLQVP